MGYPRKALFAISVLGASFLSRYFPEGLLFGSFLWSAVGYFTLALITQGIYQVLIYPKFFSPLRHLPQPPGGSFILGHAVKIFKENTGDPQREWIDTVPNDGMIYYTTIFNTPRVLPTSPEALKEVLSMKHYDYKKPGNFVAGIGRILGVGLLLAEGDEHRRQRKDLMPAFSYRHIKNLYPIFWDQTRRLILALDNAIETADAKSEKSSKAAIEVGSWVSRSTLDIIGVATMGKSFGAIEDDNNELSRTYRKLFNPPKMARVLGFLGLVLPMWFLRALPLKRNDELKQASDIIKDTARNMVLEKKEKRSKGEASGADILSVAMDSGNFTDENLVNQLMTFLAAGHETTASALTWAILLLCQHPEIQTRLRKDLQDAGLPDVRDPSSNVTTELLDRIPYLEAVCSEVLRFIPPVALTLRESTQPETLLGHPIPANTTVLLCPSAINHSKALWGPDARAFNPDRWLDPPPSETKTSTTTTTTETRSPADDAVATAPPTTANHHGGAPSAYAFMTFLHGPRGCIGQGFSRAEFACLLAGWVQAFETRLRDEDRKIEVAAGITQKPRGGLEVFLTPVG